MTVMTSGLMQSAIVAVLKRVFRRPRPSRAAPGLSVVLADPDAFSFPSGHSAVAFAVALAACHELPPLGGAEIALASGIAFSRVYLGAILDQRLNVPTIPGSCRVVNRPQTVAIGDVWIRS